MFLELLRIFDHRAELVHREVASAQPHARLTEEDGPRRNQPDAFSFVRDISPTSPTSEAHRPALTQVRVACSRLLRQSSHRHDSRFLSLAARFPKAPIPPRLRVRLH